MEIKPGVRINGIKPELLFGLMVAESVYKDNDSRLVVTSIMDGSHMEGSLHYVGHAANLRKPLDQSSREIAIQLGEQLGPQWDVVLEPTHIHIEFDPNYKK